MSADISVPQNSVMLAFYFSNAVGVVILMAVVLPHFVLNLIGAGVDGLVDVQTTYCGRDADEPKGHHGGALRVGAKETREPHPMLGE